MTSSPKNLIILGIGGHALSVADAVLSAGWKLGGFYSPEGSDRSSALGSVFTTLDSVEFADTAFALGIGTNYSREDVATDLIKKFPQVEIVSVIHASASVSSFATVKPGAVILAHAVVGPGSTVGRGALLNTGASLDHESTLEDFSSLGPGAYTAGNVSVGKRTMVGMKAGIVQGIRIGQDSVVGAHSLVKSNLGDNVMAWGIPARVQRIRSREQPYY